MISETSQTPKSVATRADLDEARGRSDWRATVKLLASSALLACAVFVALVGVVVPAVAGSQTYTVLTGSMEPGLPPGTLLVVRSVPIENLRIGDVLTYQLESGKSAVVTHRITAIELVENGERRFTTQGDANSMPDANLVLPVQIRGAVWYAIPYLGWLSGIRGDEVADVWTPIVAGLVFCYAGVMIVGAVRDRRRRKLEDTQL